MDSETVDQPPPETFQTKYSPHSEMPSSVMLAFLLHGVFLAIFILYQLLLLDHDPRIKNSKIPPIAIGDGMDDRGDGSINAGGDGADTIVQDTAPTKADLDRLTPIDDLPTVKEDIKEAFNLGDGAELDIPEEKQAVYSALDRATRQKVLGRREQGGTGTSKGTGSGPAGTGNDSVKRRSLNWIIRFRTTDGRDYLQQLAAMRATVVVPLPPDNKKMYLFRDLNNPRPGQFVTDEELRDLSSSGMQFSDAKRDSVEGIRRALGMDETPQFFFAYFPQDILEEMANLEKTYRNRKPEEIKTTWFRVALRGGKYHVMVEQQDARN